MEKIKFICPICGSHEVEIKDGVIFCLACESYFYDETVKKGAVEEDDIKRISSFDRAEEYLRLSPPRFDEAEDRYLKLCNDYPNVSSAYWGALRAKYGIKYEIDTDGKAIPVCYKSKYQNIKEDKLYDLALSTSENPKIKDKYLLEADRIEETWKAWAEATKKYYYDVFLSFKVSDERGDDTPDKKLMGELYTYLTGKGYKVFYSPVSMREYTGKPFYDAYIFNALEKSNVLIVYGSKPEYFTSTWVENEWMRYLTQISRKEKLHDSLILTHQGFNPTKELPTKLSKRESYDASSYTFFPDVLKLVNNVFKNIKVNNPNKKKITKKPILKHVDVTPFSDIKKEINEDLDIYDLGVNNPSKHIEEEQEIHLREIKIEESSDLSASNLEKLDTALICLSNHKFAEAASLFKDIVKADKNALNGYVGLLASYLHDATLYDKIIKDKETEYRYIQTFPRDTSKKMGKNINAINDVLNHVSNKYEAVNLLKYLLNGIIGLLYYSEYRHYSNDIYIISKLILSYDTEARSDYFATFIAHIDDFMRETTPNVFNELALEVSKMYKTEDIDDYLDFLEKITVLYTKQRNYKQAYIWNERKLKSYQGDPSSNIRKIYFKLHVKDESGFYSLHNSKYIAPKVTKMLEVCIKKASKDDVDKLLEDIVEITDDAARSRKKVLYRNGKYYLNFLSKYKFNKKATLQNNLTGGRLLTLVSNNHIDYIYNLARTISYEDNNLTVSRIHMMITALRDSRLFLDAKKIADIGLSRFKNNPELLYDRLLAEIKYDNRNAYAVSYNDRYYNQKALENILKYSSSNDQIKVISDLADLLEASLQVIYHPKRFRALIEAFDLTIRYIPFTDNQFNKRVDELALKCLERGQYVYAKRYALLSLDKTPTGNINAHYVLLMCKIKCNDEEALKYSKAFSRDLVEYKDLIVACKDNYQKLNYYSNLADKNEEYSKKLYARRYYRKRNRQTKKSELRNEKSKIKRLKHLNPHHNGDISIFEMISFKDIERALLASGIILIIGGIITLFIPNLVGTWIMAGVTIAVAVAVALSILFKK